MDDGSRDHTAEVVRKYKSVRLVCHRVNRGYGAALKTGLSRSSGEIVAFLDADGTYPPEYFPKLIQIVIDGADHCHWFAHGRRKNRYAGHTPDWELDFR